MGGKLMMENHPNGRRNMSPVVDKIAATCLGHRPASLRTVRRCTTRVVSEHLEVRRASCVDLLLLLCWSISSKVKNKLD